MYDVIIVGAGPAGSMLAKKLADADLKVLLVEQKKLPRHKMCSGIISSFARRVLKKEGIGDVPDVLCCHPKKIKGVQIYPAKGQPPQKYRENSRNVWRSDFDFWLTTKASEAGADILDQTQLVNFTEEKDKIAVNLKTIFGNQKQEGRILVGADSGTSLIRRILFEDEKIIWTSVYQAYWKGEIDLDPQYLHTFLDREFSEFFALMNVKTGTKGKYIIINTNAMKGTTIPNYYNAFQEYLEEAHGFRGEKLLFKEACTSPKFFDSSYEYKFGKNNVLLIGEAAGLFNIFAEGISPALTSAVNASDVILESTDQVLDRYKKKVQPLCNSLKIGWETLLKMFPDFLQ
ncbi:MAG: NAD(P)/FAD-dependent oxidoreductase [Candidatus Helarchaeota archaeon]|nr:NAD(P)/FAD-dependent oxidoreductase [Candidatus Helarchaeota archaeon]